jgi:hypothetical protein
MKIEISSIRPNLALEVGYGESWLTFQFEDIHGTVRNAAITPHAARSLVDACADLSQTLLYPLIDAQKSVTATVEYEVDE